MKVFCYFINSKDILRRFKYSMLKSMLLGLCYPISILFIFDFIFLSYLINMFSVYLFLGAGQVNYPGLTKENKILASITTSWSSKDTCNWKNCRFLSAFSLSNQIDSAN